MDKLEFDLQLFGQSPSFVYTATGVGKETTFAVAASPTLWISARDITMTGTNQWLERQSARQQIGREDSETGPFMGSGSFTVESDPDVIGSLLAWGMGSESIAPNATSGNPATGSNWSHTLTAAAAAGATTLTLNLTTNVAAGQKILIDTANPQLTESAIVASLSGSTVTLTTPLVNSHANGATVTFQTAYDHTLVLGIPRPTFTVQFNRITDVVYYSGNKVSQMDISITPRDLVAVRFGTVYCTEGIVAAGTPAFSIQKPYRVIDPNNTLTVNGQQTPAGILSATFSIATGLSASEFVLANGRVISNIPEGQARVTATMTVQFSNDYYQQLFWGAVGATGPNSTVYGVNLSLKILSPSPINAAVNYQTIITLANCKITTAPVAGRTGSTLQQTLTIDGYQTAPGANNDIAFVVTNANANAS